MPTVPDHGCVSSVFPKRRLHLSIPGARQGRIVCRVFLPAGISTGGAGRASRPGHALPTKLRPFVGVVADFDGNYGTLDGGKTRVHTFVFGPQVSLPAKVSPFAHALFGVAKESQDSPTNLAFSSLGSDTSFATALGVGIDVKAARFLSIRFLQVDYLRTNLHGTTQNQPRVSAGIVLHF